MPNIQNLTQKMNLNKLWPKNETEGLLLSITLIKQTPTKPQETLEFTDFNLMLKHLLPNNVKISVTIDDIRLKSNLNIKQTSIFTKKSFSIQF